MTQPNSDRAVRLAKVLGETIDLYGIKTTARAFQVTIPELKRLLKTREFDEIQMDLAVEIRLLPAEE